MTPELGMGMGQKLEQRQILSLKQQQSLKFLTMPMFELAAELRQQMAANPMIEEIESRTELPMAEALPQEHASGQVTERELDFTPDGDAAENVLGADDGYRDYFMGGMENADCDEEAQSRRQYMFDKMTGSETLQDRLMAQLGASGVAPEDRDLAEMLIEGINEAGYFDGSFADLRMVTGASEERVLAVQAEIMKFDPPGCGGRNLRECLLGQMEKLDDSPWEDEVRAVIDRHLEHIERRQTDRVCRDLGITPEELEKVLKELRTLDPRPGLAVGGAGGAAEAAGLYVKPEVTAVKTKSGRWTAHVEARDVPRIRISKRYAAMLEQPGLDKAAREFLLEKRRHAEALQEMLDNRHNTIKKISQAILDVQGEALDGGSLAGIKPLTMQRVAETVGLHDTTVSRTVNSKWMSLPAPVTDRTGRRKTRAVLLRDFFTSGMAGANGEMVANRQVQDWIRKIIEGEDKAKPYSDEKISALLLERHGMKVARRTVAKYRDAVGIPGTAARRVAGC